MSVTAENFMYALFYRKNGTVTEIALTFKETEA